MQRSAQKRGDVAEIPQGCAGVVCGMAGTHVTHAPCAVSHCGSAELLLPVLQKRKDLCYSSTTGELLI